MGALYHLGAREEFETQKARPILEDIAPNTEYDGAAAAQGAAQTARATAAAAASGYSGLTEESGALHSFLEHAATYSFFLLFAAALYFSLSRLAGHNRLWLVAFAVPLGMMAGDFVSGLAHWLADTYGTERTPLVGGSFIKWFRLHHVYPKDICTHNFIATNGNTCILSAPLVALCLPLVRDEEVSATRAFFVLTTVLMTATTVATNQFHKWAHEDAPSCVARVLQRAHLILRPQHHSFHHMEPFKTDYCIANGWMNPLLERIEFFGRLERGLSKFGMNRNQEPE